MKKILLSLFILFLPSVTLANPTTNVIVSTFDVVVSCVDSVELDNLSSSFNELPVFRAISIRQENNKTVSRLIVLFFNPKEKTYTLYEKFGQDLYCVISLGFGLEMINPSDYSNKPKS